MGDGPKYLPKDRASQSKLQPDYAKSFRKIPVIGKTAGGDPIMVVDDYPPGFAEKFIPGFNIKDPNAFALQIDGDSMEPRYWDGDYVIASPNTKAEPGAPVIYKVNDEDTACKLWRETGTEIIFLPINPKHKTLIFRKRDINWLYPVVALYREEK